LGKRIIITILGCLALGAALGAHAQSIYRWVDADGVVHYGGNPPKGVEATLVTTARDSGGLGMPDAPQADAPATDVDPQSDLSYAEQRRRERAEQREAQMQARAERERNCAVMRQQRDALEPSTRVLVNDENGNPVRMADEDRLASLEQAKTYLAANCGNGR
jgi:hypothetical protein